GGVVGYAGNVTRRLWLGHSRLNQPNDTRFRHGQLEEKWGWGKGEERPLLNLKVVQATAESRALNILVKLHQSVSDMLGQLFRGNRFGEVNRGSGAQPFVD